MSCIGTYRGFIKRTEVHTNEHIEVSHICTYRGAYRGTYISIIQRYMHKYHTEVHTDTYISIIQKYIHNYHTEVHT